MVNKKLSCACFPAASTAALPLPGLEGAPPCCTVFPKQGNCCKGNKNGQGWGSSGLKKLGGALAFRGKSRCGPGTDRHFHLV